MRYLNKIQFEHVNKFGFGFPNEMFGQYFTGDSFLKPLTNPEESPVFMANVTFEPGCRNNWHIHHAKSGGGQILICTAGEGWYQEAGKKPVSLTEGSFIYIPAGVKHWHGAKKDSWFSHIAVEALGVETSTEWLEPVEDEHYNPLKAKPNKKSFIPMGNESKYTDKKQFKAANMFGTGIYNLPLGKYFSGRSYLRMLTRPGKVPLFCANVNFEPGCSNNWHIHHATKNGGQILVCTVGEGWYQAEGEEPISLEAGSVVYIPAEVKHWHGAKKDSWFSHIAVEIPGENGKLEWCEAVSQSDYNRL